MSDTPWTPGPWKNLGDVGWDRSSDLIVGDQREAPVGMDTPDGFLYTAVAEVRYHSSSRFAANARLIAAAPEMAALLDDLRGWGGCFCAFPPHEGPHHEPDCTWPPVVERRYDALRTRIRGGA